MYVYRVKFNDRWCDSKGYWDRVFSSEEAAKNAIVEKTGTGYVTLDDGTLAYNRDFIRYNIKRTEME